MILIKHDFSLALREVVTTWINKRKRSCRYWFLTWRKLIIATPTEHYFITRAAEMDWPLLGSHLCLGREKKIPAPPWSDHLASLAPLPPFRSSGACSSLCCPDHGAGSDSELAEKDQSPAACFAFSPRSSPVREAWILFLFLAEPGFFAGQLRNRLCSDLGAQSSHCTQS